MRSLILFLTFFFGISLFFSAPALALDRSFPSTARRGTMTPASYPAIVIDGKSRMLAIGSRIWNENNLIEQLAALRGDDIAVNYTETDQGEIDRVWILTPEEIRQPLRQQPPLDSQ